ncbi:hypothetical protein BGZ75_007544 [Mortierella antarctica]|nr:hypothetical protein BGZ75_007544 [Mortierella antarctica]
MRGSSTIRRKVDTIQRKWNPTARPLTFMIGMPTRWNSKYLMIERMEEILTVDDLQAAKDTIKILRFPHLPQPAAKHHELFNVRVTRGGHNELLKPQAESLIVQKLLELIKIKGLPIDIQDDAGNSSDDEPEMRDLQR